jgi:Fe2+ transport system protein B
MNIGTGWIAAASSKTAKPKSRAQRRFDTLVLLTLAGLLIFIGFLWMLLP